MNLLFPSLVQRVHDLARENGARDFRVQYKRNARGEVVVALIMIVDEQKQEVAEKMSS